MMNPEMPNIPGMGSMTDTLEFVKKLWGGMGIPGGQAAGAAAMPGMPGMGMAGMNIPGMVMPTLSVEEINKRITDLKAVESWLTLNMNMLRGTIQALEVQAATLSALNAMGQSVSATMQAAGMTMPPSPAPTAAGPGDGAAPAESASEGAPQPTPQDERDAAALTAPLVNAAAWWNALQDQFQQAVSTAMTAEPSAAPKRAARKPAAKTATKSAAAAPRKRKSKS